MCRMRFRIFMSSIGVPRRDAFVHIRGFGFSRQQDSAVGLYVDDVPLINVGKISYRAERD